eukprot:2435875-Amphidinium_carterae.1
MAPFHLRELAKIRLGQGTRSGLGRIFSFLTVADLVFIFSLNGTAFLERPYHDILQLEAYRHLYVPKRNNKQFGFADRFQ